jgi:hypothetical protein
MNKMDKPKESIHVKVPDEYIQGIKNIKIQEARCYFDDDGSP